MIKRLNPEDYTYNFRGHNKLAGDLKFNDLGLYACRIKAFLASLSLFDGDPPYKDFEICYQCGKRCEFGLEDKVIGFDSDCQFPNGHPAYNVTLNVPSGKIALGNDFRELVITKDNYAEFYTGDDYDDTVDTNFDINTIAGKAQETACYAKYGLANIYIGNSCPSVFINSDGLPCVGYVHDKDINSTILGYICTDLWWFSAMDYDDYISKNGELKAIEVLVDVEPGVYSVSSEIHTTKYFECCYDETMIYSRFVKV